MLTLLLSLTLIFFPSGLVLYSVMTLTPFPSSLSSIFGASGVTSSSTSSAQFIGFGGFARLYDTLPSAYHSPYCVELALTIDRLPLSAVMEREDHPRLAEFAKRRRTVLAWAWLRLFSSPAALEGRVIIILTSKNDHISGRVD
jgi:hypothetical protein